MLFTDKVVAALAAFTVALMQFRQGVSAKQEGERRILEMNSMVGMS